MSYCELTEKRSQNGLCTEISHYLRDLIKFGQDMENAVQATKVLKKMDNLHVKLTFNLGKTSKIFYYS